MKITKQQLKQIIKEEIEVTLEQRVRDPGLGGGSGFSGDSRSMTPAQKKAHQAKVSAMRAKEPKSEVKKAEGSKCPRCWKILETKCVRCQKAST